jgi:DNA-binding FadR family transcriptional regulator
MGGRDKPGHDVMGVVVAGNAMTSGGSKEAKLAEQISRQIERDVIALGCPVGHPLGSEAELALKYGVSRWIMREAFAITERDGLTEMRRGRTGGLVVAAPADRAVAAAICNFLLLTRVDVDEMTRVRKVVDRVVYVLAASRLDDAYVAEARALLENPVGDTPMAQAAAIYDQILRFADNPFVGVFGVTLSKLTQCLVALHDLPGLETRTPTAISRRLLDIRRRQLECILGADPSGAVEQAAAAADAWAEMFAQVPADPHPATPAARARQAERTARRIAEVLHPGKPPKLSAVIAMRIALDIVRGALRPGDSIAPEPELMAAYGVGRHVLREAIRTLEHDGFVQTEVGRRGGLRVGAPSTGPVVRRVVDYLSLLPVSAADVDVLAGEILVLAAELAARRVQAQGPQVLGALPAAVQRLQAAAGADLDAARHALRAALADVAGATVIKLFVEVVAGLSGAAREAPPIDQDALVVGSSHLEVALRAGDALLARRAVAQIIAAEHNHK